MEAIHVLVNSPGTAFYRYLRDHLPRARFEVVESGPGDDFLQNVSRLRPEVAVLGRVGERAHDVLREVRAVQQARSGAIVVSVNTVPTTRQAAAVARMSRHYVDGTQLGRPIGPELVGLILASVGDSGPLDA